MAFSSFPSCFDPLDWKQLTYKSDRTMIDSQFQPCHHLLPQTPLPSLDGNDSLCSVTQGSVSGQEMMMEFSQPELTATCPRCESTNTKFCYFNNYSLAQPRHFCRTCRRHWTRGGALRNVPVGGSRRNKRKKNNRIPESPNNKHIPLPFPEHTGLYPAMEAMGDNGVMSIGGGDGHGSCPILSAGSMEEWQWSISSVLESPTGWHPILEGRKRLDLHIISSFQ